MTETYSLAIKGRRADSPTVLTPITLGDSAARLGNQSSTMQQGTQVLCKGNDGSLAYYTIDAERSTPGAPVLLKV